MSIKVLAYGDAGASTGFEKVLREVMTYLHNTGKVEVVVQGLGYRGNPDYKYPYPVWPAEHNGDWFGMAAVRANAERHKADAMFLVQDIWNIVSYMAHKPEGLPAITYSPVDTPNMKWSYALSMGAVAEPVAYTRFGAVETAAGIRDAINLLVEGSVENKIPMDEKRTFLALPHPRGPDLTLRLERLSKYQNIENWNIIPHGLDREQFRPISEKALVRKQWGLKEGDFIVGSVNTNQFRKRQDLLIRAFAMLRNKVPNAKLVVYCTNADDERGWDLPQLARYAGITDSVYFVHAQIDRNLTDQELCELYNCCDVMVNTAGGEGWGLTSMEGAACGVAQIVPDWSATREIWKGYGLLNPVVDWRIEPKFLNTAHAIIDVKWLAEVLVLLANDAQFLKNTSESCFDLANQQPSWTDVGKQFERVIFKAVNQSRKPAEPRTFNDILLERQGIVESELARAVYMEDGVPVKV